MSTLTQLPYLPQAVDELSTGIMFVDARLHVVYANYFAASLSGEQPRDLIGCSIRELACSRFGSAVGRNVTRRYIDVLRTGQSYIEGRWESPLQPGFFTEQHMRCLRDPDGKPVGVLVTINDVTDYVHVERALRESEERYRIVADFTYNWEYWEDPSGSFVYISPSVEAITGYPASMFLDSPKLYSDIMHPEDRKWMIGHSPDIHGKPGGHSVDFRITRRDGSERWIGHVCQRVFAADGTFLGNRGSNRDITERKELETQLRKSEERLLLAKDAAGLGIFDHDARSGTAEWDERTRELWGVGPNVEITAEVFYAGVHPDDREYIGGVIRRALDPSGPHKYYSEYRVINQEDGTERWVAAAGDAFFEQGQPVRLVGTVQDITDRKKTEEALRESEQRFFSAFEYAAIGMAIVSPEGRWLRVNRAFSELVGYSKDELLARTFQDITHPDDLETDLGYVRQMLAAEINTYQMEKRYFHKSGRIVWVSLSVSLVRDELGSPLYFVSQIQDISERKRAEDQLRLAAEREAEARHRAQRQSEQLQRALLPALPPAPEGYRVAARYVPGSPELDIGGDFYDLLITESGRIAILIGDVSGKGVEAVSLASSMRATVRAFIYDILSPAQALTHTNAVISSQERERQSDSYQFSTVGLVVIDPETGRLQYTSAGHPPPMIRRPRGTVDTLRVVQPPVGTEHDTRYIESDSQLYPGDKIILYTDGISEARRGLEFFDLEGIENTLKRCGDVEPAMVVENLISDATSWVGGTLRDDTVVIVVERLQVAA